MKIEGSVALITGGASGIGLAVCEELLRRNAKGVAIVDLNLNEGEKVQSDLNKVYGENKALFIKTDVTSDTELEASYRKTKEAYGRLDIVFNNAGICNEENWRFSMNINLMAVMSGTYLALEHMGKCKQGDGGVVINMSSIMGFWSSGMPPYPAYTAAKHGIIGFSRAISQLETSKGSPGYGIRVNILCPVWVRTPMLQRVKVREEWEKVVENLPARAFTTTETVVKAFIRLVEDDSLNGACLKVLTHGQYLSYPGIEIKMEDL